MLSSFTIKKNIIIYFILFGFVLGVINSLDNRFYIFGRGDTPPSLLINQPGTFLLQIIRDQFTNISKAKVKQFEEDQAPRVKPPPLKLLDISSQSAIPAVQNRSNPGIADKIAAKSKSRSDWLIGEKGLITWYLNNDGKVFPFISAVAWGLLGFVIYVVAFIFKKYKFESEK